MLGGVELLVGVRRRQVLRELLVLAQPKLGGMHSQGLVGDVRVPAGSVLCCVCGG